MKKAAEKTNQNNISPLRRLITAFVFFAHLIVRLFLTPMFQIAL
jgi:hypothetical protein